MKLLKILRILVIKEPGKYPQYKMKDENEGILEMELTDIMQKEMIKVFEIEMLQGDYKKLPDGRHSYKIRIDSYKSELVKQFIKNMVQKPDKDTKFMGNTLNPN